MAHLPCGTKLSLFLFYQQDFQTKKTKKEKKKFEFVYLEKYPPCLFTWLHPRWNVNILQMCSFLNGLYSPRWCEMFNQPSEETWFLSRLVSEFPWKENPRPASWTSSHALQVALQPDTQEISRFFIRGRNLKSRSETLQLSRRRWNRSV